MTFWKVIISCNETKSTLLFPYILHVLVESKPNTTFSLKTIFFLKYSVFSRLVCLFSFLLKLIFHISKTQLVQPSGIGTNNSWFTKEMLSIVKSLHFPETFAPSIVLYLTSSHMNIPIMFCIFFQKWWFKITKAFKIIHPENT